MSPIGGAPSSHSDFAEIYGTNRWAPPIGPIGPIGPIVPFRSHRDLWDQWAAPPIGPIGPIGPIVPFRLAGRAGSRAAWPAFSSPRGAPEIVRSRREPGDSSRDPLFLPPAAR